MCECDVAAFRAIQHELGLEEVYVLGTNCADNSPTPKAAREFIQKGMKIDNSQKVRGYEFMQVCMARNQCFNLLLLRRTTTSLTDDGHKFILSPYFMVGVSNGRIFGYMSK
jgi:hypothetical protein